MHQDSVALMNKIVFAYIPGFFIAHGCEWFGFNAHSIHVALELSMTSDMATIPH